MRFERTPLVWVIDNVYSKEECAQHIENIERWGPSIATNNAIYRNQDRVMRDDPQTAKDLFERIRTDLPQQIGDLSLNSLNERLRYYRYQTGQQFPPHMDHWYQPDEHHITLLTLLVYFNDDFEGGETIFHEQIEKRVIPSQGSVLLFQHKVRHEGCLVTRGRKYAMRTDVVYRSPRPIQLVLPKLG